MSRMVVIGALVGLSVGLTTKWLGLSDLITVALLIVFTVVAVAATDR